MQNQDQPVQQTDKNKGDQSAAEQQQKETLKKPSPENMSGADDGAPVNPSGKGNEDVNMESNRQDQWQGKDKNQANKGDMGGSNKGDKGGSNQGKGSSNQGQGSSKQGQ